MKLEKLSIESYLSIYKQCATGSRILNGTGTRTITGLDHFGRSGPEAGRKLEKVDRIEILENKKLSIQNFELL